MKSKILLLLSFLYLFVLLLQPSIEMTEDLGRQIKMGEIILNCRCIPQENLFSYTFSQFPIVNYSWLSSVIFYLFSIPFGISALFYLKIVMYLSIFGILFLSVRKKVSLIWFSIFMILVINIFSNRLIMRPEVLSFLFLSLYFLIINRYQQTNNYKILYILPIIQILWVNMHVYFFIGPLLYIFFIIETFLRHKRAPNKNEILVLLLILASNLINPLFFGGAIYPLLIFNSYGIQIDENFSPFSKNPLFLSTYSYYIWIFEITILFLFLGIALQVKKIPVFLTLSTIFFMILSFYLVRVFPLFALSALLSLSVIYSASENKLRKLDDKFPKLAQILILTLFAFLIIFQVKNLITNKKINPIFMTDQIKGVTFVKEQGISGPFFNSLGIGGNAIYQLYPQKVFIDARPEAYPQDFAQNYQKHFTDINFFLEQEKKYKFNALLIANYENYYWTNYLISMLLKSGKWKVVYNDNYMTVVVKNITKNKKIIDLYEIKI